MKKYDLCIIGAGASGLTAAITALEQHPEYKILLLEHLPRVGKKILATGNGRCNLTNLNACSHKYRNKDFAQFALNKYNPETVIAFFEKLGLKTYSDECGRVYPRSNTATAVLDTLRFALKGKNAEIICDYEVKSLKKSNNIFEINNEYSCDKLIIACGGKSSAPQGSDGTGFALAKNFGHKSTRLYPALVPLNTYPEAVRSLKGVRATGVNLTISDEENEDSSFGEILFTDNGISGIAVMELASFAERSLYNGFAPILTVDYLPEMSEDELGKFISDTSALKQGQPFENLLMGVLPKQIGVAVMKSAGIYYGGGMIEELTDNMISNLIYAIKNAEFKIAGTKGFLNSQVTSGGIKTSEVNAETMMSKLEKNLYFCGEILDVDGRCGGFNLQWAFASGMLAGELND